jgi:esterase/lipase
MPYTPKSASIEAGSLDAPRHVVIFHGYTGSPDEFRALADRLSSELDAYVSVPLLPGHGTNESELLWYGFDDFLHFAKEYVDNAARSGKKLIIMGHSFGGYLAMLTAAQAKPDALILTVVPFSLRFPLWLPGAAWFMRKRTWWEKDLSIAERMARLGLFYYRQMPGLGLSLVKEGIDRCKKVLPQIDVPIFAITTEEDPIVAKDSGRRILAMCNGNPANESIMLEDRQHGLFYGPHAQEAIDAILAFTKKVVRK